MPKYSEAAVIAENETLITPRLAMKTNKLKYSYRNPTDFRQQVKVVK